MIGSRTVAGNRPEPDGLSIRSNGRAIRLKWHKARRHAVDLPFERGNIRAALALGASCEVDIRRLADPVFVCLHDDELSHETDGVGLASQSTAKAVTALTYRHTESGRRGGPPLFLQELASMVAANEGGVHQDAQMQLDLKEERPAITDDLIGHFVGCATGCARYLIVSGDYWDAVDTLAGAVPGVTRGYDPLALAIEMKPRTHREFAAFVRSSLAAAPKAAVFYLHHEIIVRAAVAGAPVVGDLQGEGREVDCWTLDPDHAEFEDRLATVIASGVDQITTNAPLAVQEHWSRLDTD